MKKFKILFYILVILFVITIIIGIYIFKNNISYFAPKEYTAEDFRHSNNYE